MEVILLERITKLGQMGDIVNVKNGYARNFLLPSKKALRANEKNKALFEKQRVHLEARNLERKNEAEKIAEKLENKKFIIIRSAGETGHLYGSVSTRDIVEVIDRDGFALNRNQIELNHPIKAIGLHILPIHLHPEVCVEIVINVARSEDEAKKQEAGQELTSVEAIYGEEVSQASKNAAGDENAMIED